MDLTGRIVKVMNEVSGESKNGTWVKQEFVVETADQFPKKICITLWGDKVQEFKSYKPGDEVKVYINIESREYNDRWYTDVKAWKIEPAGASSSSTPPPPEHEDAFSNYDETNDDLPF